jgi:hypothetical protein
MQMAGGGQGLDLAALTQEGRGGPTSTWTCAARDPPRAPGGDGDRALRPRRDGGRAHRRLGTRSGAADPRPRATPSRFPCAAMRWDADRGTARTRVFYLEGAPGRAARRGHAEPARRDDRRAAERGHARGRPCGCARRCPVDGLLGRAAPRNAGFALQGRLVRRPLGEQLEAGDPRARRRPAASKGAARPLPDCAGALPRGGAAGRERGRCPAVAQRSPSGRSRESSRGSRACLRGPAR